MDAMTKKPYNVNTTELCVY